MHIFVGYNKSMKDRYSAIIRITGFFLIIRALMFLGGAISIGFGLAFGKEGENNDLIMPLIFCVIYFVFCAILSMRLAGVFMGSKNSQFRNRLDKLTFSNYQNGSEYANRAKENAAKGENTSVEVDTKKLEAALSKKASEALPYTGLLDPRAALIFLLADLLMAVLLLCSLPGLSKIYIDLVIEAIAIMAAFIEIFNATANK